MSNELSKDTIIVPSVYKEIFLDNYRYFLLASGRCSGKTSILVALWWVTYNKFPDRDIVILQSTQTEIENSLIVEIEKFMTNSGYQVGDSPNDTIYIPKSKESVKWRNHQGTTYFFPITDSKGGQRSRGITTPNKLSLVMYEEAQKNKDRNIVDQSVITFIRQLDKEAKLIVVGNNETVGHWFIDYVEEKKQDKDWCYIYSTCFDIWELLNEQTQDYILNQRASNELEFKRIFLGDIHASTSDVVFPQFIRKKHYKLKDELSSHFIVKVIIGIDHATANDKFAAVPVAILDDGTTQTLEILVDDPKETNITLAPTEQCELFDNFLYWLDMTYDFSINRMQIILSVDGAAAGFVEQLKHTKKTSYHKEIWRQCTIKSFTKKQKYKDINGNLAIIKNAFAYNVLTILNEGDTCWDGSLNKHRLAREIEQQRYKNGKLDPRYENDICDALEYGLVPYYTNCYNISFPVRIKNKSHYDEIRTGIKELYNGKEKRGAVSTRG